MAESVRIKVLVVGPFKSGKSCLIKNYCEGRFVKKYLPTIGIDYGVRTIEIQGVQVKVNFFDASGAPEFKAIRTEFYEESQAIVYVVDLSDPNQLTELQQFVEEANQYGPRFQFLVGTKMDMGVKIPDADLKNFCRQINGKDFKVSSVTGENVEMCFMMIFKNLYNSIYK